MAYRDVNGRARQDSRRLSGPPSEIYRLQPGEKNARSHDPMGMLALGHAHNLPSGGLRLSA